MPIETNLNQAPYFDDYDESKQYVKVLGKPEVAVQAREFNQLQTMLQKQIERFGDNILKRGTIVDGCNFSFYSEYPYIKIFDLQKDGKTAIPSNFVGYRVKSANAAIGLDSYVINYEDGFESTSPDLKTLYLNYINSGVSGNTSTFSASDIVTIYDPRYPIFSVKVNNGGISFANTDSVVVSPSIIANVSSGSFTNGEYIYQPSTGANLQIISIDANTLSSTNQVILSLKPRNSDLSNVSATYTSWTIANNNPIRNSSNTVTASVEGIIGSGMDGIVTTDSTGKIVDFTVTNRGSGYTTLPYVTVASANNTTGLTNLSLSPQNYYANVQVYSTPDAIGSGYAFSVSDGIVYQKGYFSIADEQTIIVSKYSNSPTDVVVGFDTVEEIVNSRKDPSLNDNSFTSKNYNAPGADRLKLVPTLIVSDAETAKANASFLTLVEWSDGNPFKQNQTTQYNKIEDEIARGIYEQSGNYSVDLFQITTKSPANTALEASSFDIVVDPGTAYINGYRVSTSANFIISDHKGTDVATSNVHTVTLDYGSFVRVKEVAGVFQFSTGDTVGLYDTAAAYLSNTAAAISGNVVAVGSQIGSARMRSMVYSDGSPGSNNATYKLYLFGVNMNVGKNFRDVKSVYYNGVNKGIADIVTTLDGTLNKNVARLESTNTTGLLFSSGVTSMKSSNSNIYTYRTIDQALTIANNTGRVVKDISGIANEYFPYSANLTDSDLATLYMVPSADLAAYNSITGTVSVTSTSANVVGTSTTFLNDLQAGDFIKIANTTSGLAKSKVASVVNNTFLTLAANAGFTDASSSVYNFYPKSVPIKMNARVPGQTPHSANVNSNGNILTIQMKYANGSALTIASANAIAANISLGVNIQRVNVAPITKTTNRSVFVKIATSNNVGGTSGPWCLGVPDMFRLRAVYIGNSSVSNTSPNAVTDFYADHNQNADYLDLSYLYLKPSAATNLANTDYLLVQFDYGTQNQSGFVSTTSYLQESNVTNILVNDSLPLANLTTFYNSWEVPQIYTSQGNYYDLLSAFDFRPVADTTVTPNTNFNNAPLNPAYGLTFGNTYNFANDKKFPLPQSAFSTKIDYYMPRVDSVFVDINNNISVKNGIAKDGIVYAPSTPQYSMRIGDIIIPAYPDMPINPSDQIKEIITTRMGNEVFSTDRTTVKRLTPFLSNTTLYMNQPSNYTKEDIGSIDRRLSAVEYYTSLSLLESDIKNRIIPSSTNPTLDRFKYGFFVDDFTTSLFAETSNPQYAAAIENDKVIPSKYIINNDFLDGGASVPYIDYSLVSQGNATYGPNNSACVPSTTIANNWILKQQITNRSTTPGKNEIDSVAITLSSVSAPATFYGYFYSQWDEISIYQGNTLLLTANNATALSAADKVRMKSSAVPSGWFQAADIDLNNVFTLSGNGVNFAFKIAWNHNPSKGLNYSIVTKKNSTVWRYALEYPINSSDVTCPSTPGPTPILYNGTMLVHENVEPQNVNGSRNSGGQQTGGGVSYSFSSGSNGTAPATVSTGQTYSSGSGTVSVSQASSGSSSSSSSRVICTHFFKKGMMDRDLWRADLEFTFKNLSSQTVRGYQFWAIPYVRLMRKSPLAEKIMLPLAKARAEELAYKIGKREKGNWFGKIVRLIGEPMAYIIGAFVPEQDWESLWTENGVKK